MAAKKPFPFKGKESMKEEKAESGKMPMKGKMPMFKKGGKVGKKCG